jgi:hypothetical protein
VPDSRALKYPASLIDDQPQPPILLQKRQSKSPGIFPDALLASGCKAPGAQLLQHLLGLEPQIPRNDRRVEADCIERKLCEIHCSEFRGPEDAYQGRGGKQPVRAHRRSRDDEGMTGVSE